MGITLAVLASGRGSNLKAIITAIEQRRLDADIGVVISNIEDAPALTIAREHMLKSVFIDPKRCASKEEYDKRIAAVLKKHNTGLVCLAGYMKILTPAFIKEYKGKIINIHPSLLPAFPGLSVQKKALEYGVRYSGCTVHFVDEGVDTGPIILQAVVPVKENDTAETLAERILIEEHKIYPMAIQYFSDGRLVLEGRRVIIKKKTLFTGKENRR